MLLNSAILATALVGGTVYTSPDDEPIRNGVVLVENGRIVAVGGKSVLRGRRAVETIDCSGQFVTAGFWNSHVHFLEKKWANAAAIPAPELGEQLQEMLTKYGFTSVFDLSSPWE